jgi:hypothetical protein
VKCIGCVLMRFGCRSPGLWCKIEPADRKMPEDSDWNAWLARECVRDDERRRKLIEQLEDGAYRVVKIRCRQRPMITIEPDGE